MICRKCGEGPIRPQWVANHVIKGAQGRSSTGGLRSSFFRQGTEYSWRLDPQALEKRKTRRLAMGPGFPARHGRELESDLKTVAIEPSLEACAGLLRLGTVQSGAFRSIGRTSWALLLREGKPVILSPE